MLFKNKNSRSTALLPRQHSQKYMEFDASRFHTTIEMKKKIGAAGVVYSIIIIITATATDAVAAIIAINNQFHHIWYGL